MNKNIVIALIVLLQASQSVATVITNTHIQGTHVKQNGLTNTQSNARQTDQYNRQPLDDEIIRQRVREETQRLNAFTQSTLRGMTANAKKGEFDLVFLGGDESRSVAVSDIVPPDVEWEAENNRREMEEKLFIEKLKKEGAKPEEVQAQILKSIFPVKTHLKPTQLPSRVLSLPEVTLNSIATPVAVIGADPYSLEWFKSNVEVIRQLQAGVIVTQVETMTDFDVIRTLAPDLRFQPVDASIFLTNLGVNVYPILITRQGALQ